MSLESRIDGIEARIHADNVALPVSSGPRFTKPQMSSRKGLGLTLPCQQQQQMMPRNETENKLREIMKASGVININGTEYRTDMKDLRELELLGDGTSGHVVKMLHISSGAVIAVKQMRRTGNAEENKRIVTDIDTALKATGCPYIVQCLGFIITSADVWICMELMATCFDKLLKRGARPVPEEILGKVTVATVKALSFLKDKDTMHRDVKPSNILVNELGVIKLCDFGISGQLNNSKAKTRSAGCVAYLAPERIDPNRSEYDIRADVWSLGITLVELATGKFPYQDCRTDFEVLTCVMQSAPPTLPADQGFSLEFQNFVKRCLIHDVNRRPKYKDLLLLPFLIGYESKSVNVAGWLKSAMRLAGWPTQQRDQLPRNQSEDNEYTTGYQQIELCNPKIEQVTAPQHRLFETLPTHAPERHPFAKPPSTSSPDSQYCTLHLNSFAASTVTTRTSQPQHYANYEQSVVPEPSKVYRKSPFLPRKKEGAESNPKKESKLSTLGCSLLKNFTTSPFSQRKQPVQQNELPPFLYEKRSTNFPSHRPVESGNSQLPRPNFQNSPLLQRRNPSYISYADRNASPIKGRGSANTSPIVLQRFFHQQNQLREKIGDECQTSTAPSTDYICEQPSDNSNPFLSVNYNPHSRPVYQSKDDYRGEMWTDEEQGAVGYASGFGDHPINTDSKEKAGHSTGHRGLRATHENKFGAMHSEAAIEPSSNEQSPATNGKNYERNLGWFNSFAGDVKKRFASYLKVNLSEERRIRTEEFSYQTNHQNPQPSFAPTNPFLDEQDSCLVPPDHAADKLKLDRRHRSPDPPPRFNRQSPLLLRKKLELSNWGGSPLLSRKFISSSPPIQPPRRDCESVPGSPQHFRTRIHYTPEPQRRFYRP